MSAFVFFLVTLSALLLIFVFVALLKRPIYRLSRENVINLLELVLSNQATEDDWNVFVEMPIRHDDELESVRKRCFALSEQSGFSGQSKPSFSQAQRQEIALLVSRLKKKAG